MRLRHSPTINHWSKNSHKQHCLHRRLEDVTMLGDGVGNSSQGLLFIKWQRRSDIAVWSGPSTVAGAGARGLGRQCLHSARRGPGPRGAGRGEGTLWGPDPHTLAPFCSSALIQRHSDSDTQNGSRWIIIIITIHLPGLPFARHTGQVPMHAHPLAQGLPGSSAAESGGEQKRTLSLYHLIPLTPSAPVGPSRSLPTREASAGLRSTEKIQKTASLSTRQTTQSPQSVHPSPLSWTLARGRNEQRRQRYHYLSGECTRVLTRNHFFTIHRVATALPAALLKICQDNALQETKTNSL